MTSMVHVEATAHMCEVFGMASVSSCTIAWPVIAQQKWCTHCSSQNVRKDGLHLHSICEKTVRGKMSTVR